MIVVGPLTDWDGRSLHTLKYLIYFVLDKYRYNIIHSVSLEIINIVAIYATLRIYTHPSQV